MSVSADTLERIKQQLKEARDCGSSVKLDLYTHLTEVFNRIMLHHPYDAFDKFEEISHLIKKTHLKIQDPKYDYEVNQIQHRQNNPAQAAWIEKSKNLLKEVVDQISREERDMLTRDKTFVISNINEEARMFEWAGVGFGEEETFKLSKAIKVSHFAKFFQRLAVLSGASQLRFWGKLYGRSADFWVVEGILESAEEDKVEKDQEPRGVGVNKQVYWVTTNLLDDWIQLPDAKPDQVACATKIKYILTGNLNAQIDSNPPFPGKERHFLRSQIARITHATSIIPKGLLEIDEETNKEKYAEEFAVPGTEELKSLETWCHQHANILKSGRVTHAEPEGMGEEEKEEYMGKLAEADPIIDRFRTLNEDAPILGLETSWQSKLVGDPQPYNQLPPKEGTATYAVNVIKSLRWPGAVTVSQNGKFASIYVGYGLKRGDVCFNPTEPPEVQRDPLDQSEQPEPTPLVAPEEPPEEDTDKPKKGEGEEGEEDDQ